MKAMEDEPRVDLLKMFWTSAKVEEGRDRVEGSSRCLNGGKECGKRKKTKKGWERFEPEVPPPLRMEHRCSPRTLQYGCFE